MLGCCWCYLEALAYYYLNLFLSFAIVFWIIGKVLGLEWLNPFRWAVILIKGIFQATVVATKWFCITLALIIKGIASLLWHLALLVFEAFKWITFGIAKVLYFLVFILGRKVSISVLIFLRYLLPKIRSWIYSIFRFIRYLLYKWRILR